MVKRIVPIEANDNVARRWIYRVEWGACEPEGALGAPLNSSPRCATGAAQPFCLSSSCFGSVGSVPKNAFPLEACSFKYPRWRLIGKVARRCFSRESSLLGGLELPSFWRRSSWSNTRWGSLICFGLCNSDLRCAGSNSFPSNPFGGC